MTFLISALAFFFLITGLILIHEFGHFIVARKSKVEVEEFGFGLPPRAVSLFTWGRTVFTLNWIPFGGFVRLKGENMDEPDADRKGSFSAAPIHARCLILVAGVGMNFLLAFVIFVFGFSVGQWIPTYPPTPDAVDRAVAMGEISRSDESVFLIADVVAGSGAARAGIPAGSILEAIDGREIALWKDDGVSEYQAGKTKVEYTVLTGEKHDQRKTVTVELEDGKAGIGLSVFPKHLSAPRRGLLSAIRIAAREVKVVTVQTIAGIANLFMSLAQTGRVPEGVTGIVGIAQLTYTSVQAGFMVYLRLVALLSLSLAILNILPFPALDGGRLLFVLAETVFRTKDRRFEMITNTVGFVILIGVILLVTFFDVLRLFS